MIILDPGIGFGKNLEQNLLIMKHIKKFRLIALKYALDLEIKTGMRIHRGRTAYSIIKDEFKLKGNKQKVLNQFTKLVEERIWVI